MTTWTEEDIHRALFTFAHANGLDRDETEDIYQAAINGGAPTVVLPPTEPTEPAPPAAPGPGYIRVEGGGRAAWFRGDAVSALDGSHPTDWHNRECRVVLHSGATFQVPWGPDELAERLGWTAPPASVPTQPPRDLFGEFMARPDAERRLREYMDQHPNLFKP